MKTCWRNWLLLGAMVLIALSAGAQGPGSTNPQQSSLDFKLYRGYLIVVQGSVGNCEELNFLLDTGAERSVLDQRLSRRLGLAGESARLALLNRTVVAGEATLSEVKIGQVRTASVVVLVEDLSFLEKALRVRIDGVIGFDVLGTKSFAIDYKARKIFFGRATPMPFSMQMQTGPPLVTVDAMLDNQPVRLLVDTGASALTLFASRMRQRMPQLSVLDSVQDTNWSRNMGGQFKRQKVGLRSLRLAGQGFGGQAAFMVEDQRDQKWPFDGLLSPLALGITQVWFDFEHSRVGWAR